MRRSFSRGVMVGALAPIAAIGGVVYWVYRTTQKVPFPTRRTADGEVVVSLVEPREVPGYWELWREELAPLLDALQELMNGVVARIETELDQ